MKLNNFQIEILKQLKKRRQGASVYRLDRALSFGEFLPIMDTLLPVLRELKEKKWCATTHRKIYFLLPKPEKNFCKKKFS